METKTEKDGLGLRLARWNARHPIGALVLVSLLAVLINCHPIIFCGRSFVSPAIMQGPMIYSWRPWFPGMAPPERMLPHGSDNWAEMVQGVPMGYLEYHSLLQQGELPLWNRYGHAGQPFLGQAITMLGDPLQWLVIFGQGSALAWDLKYLAAKFLFSLGFGVLVWRLLGSQPLGLLFAALGAYCGAYFYISIHPVFFVFAYAPWILLSGLELLAPRNQHYFRWGMVWLLANFADFNAGHVEVAVILIAGLNLAALVHAMAGCRRMAEVGVVVTRLAVGTLLFLGLTAPVWLPFLAALDGAYSVHMDPRVVQLPLRCLPGAFDENVYESYYPTTIPALLPGTSQLIFFGCVLSLLRWRQARQETFFWVNLAGILIWGGCIFGWVPAAVLIHIPFLNRDGHTFTDFSYLLVIHLTLQAAYGFRALSRENNCQRAAKDLCWGGICLACMMVFPCLFSPFSPPLHYFVWEGAKAAFPLILFAYWNARPPRISLAAWTMIILTGFAAQFRFGYYAQGDFLSLRMVGPRMSLAAASPAITKMKAEDSTAYRVTGLDVNLLGDYPAVYELEDIRSCEPLANNEFMNLATTFPGIKFGQEWILEIKDAMAAQPLLNLLNVKYLLAAPDSVWPAGDHFQVKDRSDFAVVENREVWPRAFFTDAVMAGATTHEFIEQLVSHRGQPFVALSPSEIARDPGLRGLAGTPSPVVVAATNYQLHVNATAFDVQAPSAGVVCLLEGQARDFTATANGVPQPVLTANRAFKAIYLDRAGTYHIQFTFRPHHWRLACGLFWAAAGMLVLLAGVRTAAWMRGGFPGPVPEPLE